MADAGCIGVTEGRHRRGVQLASPGFGDKAIAQRLGIGCTTVRTHLGQALRKLGVDKRLQLVACLARERG
jgi:DNA-binding NarL/FixJ family response regulator